MSVIIEACCASVDDVIEAEKAGVQRVELNSAMELGGLTPGSGMVRSAKSYTKIPVMAMLRPRTGGFCYSDTEFDGMLNDCADMIAAGANGIVVGLITKDATIDSVRCAELARLVSKESMKKPKRVQLVFNRAFDIIPNWKQAMECLIQLGFDRILTSGQAVKAQDAIKTLKEMQDYSRNRIEILAAGGIRYENAWDIIRETGIKQIHLRASKEVNDKAGKFLITPIRFNSKNAASETSYNIVDCDYLSNLNNKLNSKWL